MSIGSEIVAKGHTQVSLGSFCAAFIIITYVLSSDQDIRQGSVKCRNCRYWKFSMLKCTVSFENPNTKDVKVKHAYLAYHCVLKSLQYWSICSSSMYDVAVFFRLEKRSLFWKLVRRLYDALILNLMFTMCFLQWH